MFRVEMLEAERVETLNVDGIGGLPSMPPRQGPNPWLLLGLSVASFAAFYVTVKHREQTYPASQQPRQADHPLVPPRHKQD